MRVLLTGAFGNVGLSTLDELVRKGHDVRALDLDTPANRRAARPYRGKIDVVWGDLRDREVLARAVADCQTVLHVAAIIPPLADREPELARSVNVEGTSNLIKVMEAQPQSPRLVYASSVAVYGNRLDTPMIRPGDPPDPNPEDGYAKQKLACEGLIQGSELTWSVFRLTYIPSTTNLKMDPIMFEMPLATSIEICHTRDVGLAFANAAEADFVWGKIMHIAGGPACRTTYGQHVDEMMEIFGLGRGLLPPEAFATDGYHCGFMTTDDTKALGYQRHTLEDYYREVRRQVAWHRPLLRLVRPLARGYLLRRSPYYQQRCGRRPVPSES